MIEDFRAANVKDHRLELEVEETHLAPKWLKPPLEWVKCNWDGAVDKAGQQTGVPMVVRDYAGKVVAATIRSFLFITDPTVAEALGAWHAMSLCRAWGLARVIF
jgi:hypothetical protein